VATADRERRRLERDLHDGPQQRLVSLSVRLRLLASRLAPGSEAEQLLADARKELAVSVQELRDLARGIHPATLSDRGLRAALEALTTGAPLPVELLVEPGGRAPEPVEVAAYYLVSEALTNVFKHSDATSASVSVTRRGTQLVVAVADDGVGGADRVAGTGLRGLSDRIEALGGRLDLSSPPGAGTTLLAEIPFEQAPTTTPPRGRKEANMAGSTPTRGPVHGAGERMDGDYARQALTRPGVDGPAGAERNVGVVLGAAVIAMGLVAGLYFFSAIAVMPALTAADDRTLVEAMQQIIDKIENPAFFLAFLGAPVLATVALLQARSSGPPKIAGWIVAGLVLYAVMLVITFAVHLPLNEDLKDAGDPARIENLAEVRDDFVTPWVAWDIVRTVASIAGFGALVWALALRGRLGRPGQA
jgi:uncharacterized membrane protein/two-component sensor histidine kinase